MSSICGEIINNCKNKYLLVISAGILGMKKWGTHPNPSLKKRRALKNLLKVPLLVREGFRVSSVIMKK